MENKIIEDLSTLLREESKDNCITSFFSHFSNEKPWEEIQILKREGVSLPRETSPNSKKESLVKNKEEEQKSPLLVEEKETPRPLLVQKNFLKNLNCHRCENRIYPVRRYQRQGKKPILFVYYNGSIQSTLVPIDKSDKYIFGGKAEDTLFARLLAKLNSKIEDFHYQEFIACHFNPERSSTEDWSFRSQSCLSFLDENIQKNKIQKLVLLGNASILLLGKKQAQEKEENGKSFLLEQLGSPIECIVIRSPSALRALEKKREQNQDIEYLAEIMEKEKQIKLKILNNIKNFLKL